MAIDGSVWLGSTNGRLWKFTGGREDTILPQGVDPAFGKNLVIYTSDAENNLYVLDSDSNRVVVLEKDGTYMAQYSWTDPIRATRLAVSEGQKKIYLLASGKLYTISLK
jgi:DNA-binding beta-propeller fold protein YncE